MQKSTYYLIREKFLKSELEFAKVILHPGFNLDLGDDEVKESPPDRCQEV